MRRCCAEECPPLRFPRLLRHCFPPCSLERTRAGTTFGPNNPQSLLHALLRLFSWPRRRNVTSLSALPACRPPRRNRPKSGSSGERPVFRPGPLRALVPLRALSPFLVQAPFLTQSPLLCRGPGPERSAVPKASHPVGGRQGTNARSTGH